MRYAFIRAEKGPYPLTILCRVLRVSRSGFYAWNLRKESTRAHNNRALVQHIRTVHVKSRTTYGSPRIHAELQAQGIRCSRKRVARLMKKHSIRGPVRRAFRRTTQSNPTLPVADNLLKRSFDQDKPNAVWVTDITYLRTREGWLYVAVFLDVYSRKVVGWSMSERLDTKLVLDAFAMACQARKPPKGLIHHSDRGCQYASSLYRQHLEQAGLVCSMSRKGNCWDNAVAESFFHTLKAECTDRFDFETRNQARKEVFEYIEVFYNRQRRHSSLGYLSPWEFEQKDFAA